MRRCRLLIATVGLVVAADAPKTDLEKLQGAWGVITLETSGKERSVEHTDRLKVVIKNRQLIFKGQTADQEMTFTIDPAKKPKQIDLTHPEKKVGTLPGIYSLEGDTLRICYGFDKEHRPDDFVSTAKNGRVLIVLKKE
jgi:uncharacterized protein (TIGR03067 family)